MNLYIFVIHLLAGFSIIPHIDCQGNQTLSIEILSSQPSVANSSVVVRCTAQPTSTLWSLYWAVNDIRVAVVVIRGSSPTVFINPSQYSNRISIRNLPDVLAPPDSELTSYLTISQLESSENGFVVSVEDNLSQTDNITLMIVAGCPQTLSDNVIVESTSNTFNANGRFSCSNNGKLFYSNGTLLQSIVTTCLASAKWSGQDNLQCWTAPNVTISSVFVYSRIMSYVKFTCDYNNTIPIGEDSVFHIGNDLHIRSKGDPYILLKIDDSMNGNEIFCRAITPYTQIYNDTGISPRHVVDLPFEPFQHSSTSCTWFINQPGICNVLFFANPVSEFVSLTKNESLVVNNGSNELIVSGYNHTFQFNRTQVSISDKGTYSLTVRFAAYQKIAHFVILFHVFVRHLPAPSEICTWYVDDSGICNVTFPTMRDLKFVALHKNGVLLSRVNDRLSPHFDEKQSFIFRKEKATAADSGKYVVTVRDPALPNDRPVVFDVYVLNYPFNSALVIGVTFTVILVVVAIIIFALVKARSESDKKKAAKPKLVPLNDLGK